MRNAEGPNTPVSLPDRVSHCARAVGRRRRGVAASEAYGQVTFGGLPVPGAAVTATLGDKKIVTITDEQGIYKLTDPADGTWTIRVEMLGFSPLTQDVTIAAGAPSPTFALKVLPFEEITRGLPPPVAPVTAPAIPSAARGKSVTAPAAPGQRPPPPPAGSGFQRAGVTAAAGAAPAAAEARPPADEPGADVAQGAADGISHQRQRQQRRRVAVCAAGGVRQQPPRRALALQRRRRRRSSATPRWDARPFSFTGQRRRSPTTTTCRSSGTFGGPLRIPATAPERAESRSSAISGPSDHNASTQSGADADGARARRRFLADARRVRAPGSDRRSVDRRAVRRQRHSRAIASARRRRRCSATTRCRISTPAAGYNYQTPVLTDDTAGQRPVALHAARLRPQSAVRQLRVSAHDDRHGQRVRLRRLDARRRASTPAVNWSHRFSQFFSLRLRYQFTRLTTEATPYFANRTNVSGDAGIAGNNQDPANWGPPR